MEYDKSVEIDWKERRKDFAKYLDELVNPSTPKRKQLLKDLDREARELNSFLIRFLMEEPDYEGYNSGSEEFKNKVSKNQEKYPEYFNAYKLLCRYLRPIYKKSQSEEGASGVIENMLYFSYSTGLSDDLLEKLEKEYLKLWHFYKLFWLYVGDIAEKLGEFTLLAYASDAASGYVKSFQDIFAFPLLGSLILQEDLEWAFDEFVHEYMGSNDDIPLGEYTIVFIRNRSEEMIVTKGLKIMKGNTEIGQFLYGELITVFQKTADVARLVNEPSPKDAANIDDISKFLAITVEMFDIAMSK